VQYKKGKQTVWWRQISLMVLLAVLLVACREEQAPPRAQVFTLGELSTVTPTPLPPTNTPPPTPLPSPTFAPTPRRVRVSRFDVNIAPSEQKLLEKGIAVPAVTLTDIDGNEYVLNELQGKVVILNFWTVGCGSCFYEFPLFQQVYSKIPQDQILVLAVNVSELAEQTRLLADYLHIEYPMIVDPRGQIFAHNFGGAVVPTTYFIATDGTIGSVIVGPLDESTLNYQLTELGITVPTE
jgi:thiol-disulfide isomerase/thioredoxin